MAKRASSITPGNAAYYNNDERKYLFYYYPCSPADEEKFILCWEKSYPFQAAFTSPRKILFFAAGRKAYQ